MDNNIKIGAFFMIISVTGFALMDLAVKWTTDDYSVGYVIFWRMLGGLIPLIFTKLGQVIRRGNRVVRLYRLSHCLIGLYEVLMQGMWMT